MHWWWLLAANVLKAALISGFALFLFSRLATRHLFRISRHLGAMRFDGRASPLALERPDAPADELDVLVSAVNGLDERLEHAHREIDGYQRSMEALVAERTARLEVANARLLERNRVASIGSVVALMAHELRNPLATLEASFKLLQRAPDLPPEARERVVERIDRSIARCDNTIRELRAVGRGRQLQRASVRLGTWLQQWVEAESGTPPLQLRVEADPTVQIDEVLIAQVLENLVDNARRALAGDPLCGDPVPEDPLVLQVLRRGDRAVIDVIDRGEGLPEGPPDVERLFDPLYSTRPEGGGMGLAISRQWLQDHGGELHLYSRSPGRGVHVQLSLPCAEPEAG